MLALNFATTREARGVGCPVGAGTFFSRPGPQPLPQPSSQLPSTSPIQAGSILTTLLVTTCFGFDAWAMGPRGPTKLDAMPVASHHRHSPGNGMRDVDMGKRIGGEVAMLLGARMCYGFSEWMSHRYSAAFPREEASRIPSLSQVDEKCAKGIISGPS